MLGTEKINKKRKIIFPDNQLESSGLISYYIIGIKHYSALKSTKYLNSNPQLSKLYLNYFQFKISGVNDVFKNIRTKSQLIYFIDCEQIQFNKHQNYYLIHNLPSD